MMGSAWSAAAAAEGAPAGKVHSLKAYVCGIITAAARAQGLPVGFLTRLIWQESSFRLNVISSKGAQGIAQFMPETSAERGLADPFDPVEAIPKAAELLADLKHRFGNLGLAAAAYNAGPRRVANWRAGHGTLPDETRDYVFSITQRTVEDWTVDPPRTVAAKRPAVKPVSGDAQASDTACLRYAATFKLPPSQSDIGTAISAPWGVQLAGSFSKRAVLQAYGLAKSRYWAILGDVQPILLASHVMALGFHPYYRIRMPESTRAAADALCRKLERAGGACAVLRN